MGGPQSDDSFEDSRGWCCAAYNEVAIDYNAGFTGAIARLVDYYADQKLFSDCGLDLGWEHPNATLVSRCASSIAQDWMVFNPCRATAGSTKLKRAENDCTRWLLAAVSLAQVQTLRLLLQANKPKWPENDCYHTCCRPRRSRKHEGNFHGRPRQIHHRNRKSQD